MTKWKPTFYRTNGKPGATAPMRKLARKFLENMKHRNEELGNYHNPVYRFQFDHNKFMLSSLPGYDIVDIIVPSYEPDDEQEETAEVYSGIWEPRFQASGLTGWFMRWFPAAYELFNSETDTDPPAIGASVDGAAEELTSPLPPIRWMYSDYSGARAETPWFEDSGGEVTVRRTHPGKYSGKMRELVQMQLGYGLLPEFSYDSTASEGIYLETLEDETIRIWLLQVSGTNGVVRQIAGEYTPASFEAANDLSGVPPEIEIMGWFTTQTSFDVTRPVYTQAEYDAIPEDEQPLINAVTFEMLSAAEFGAAVAGYSAHGDYGWSFNPEGTDAVLVGLGWNSPSGGGLAVNYKSERFNISFNHHVGTAQINSGGEQVFLMHSAYDQVKWPGATGLLATKYYWRGQNGSAGTQPSDAYSAPLYAYYDLNGQQITCEYTYDAGNYETQNGGSGDILTWDETAACRVATEWQGTNNNHWAQCTTGQSGTGTMRRKHGFTTEFTAPTPHDSFTGYRATWGPVRVLCNGLNFLESHHYRIWWGDVLPFFRYAAVQADTHYCAREYGAWGTTAKNVLIIPSFERLGFYHYKSLRTTINAGRLDHPIKKIYERGDPIREHGDGTIGQKDCEYDNPCAAPGDFGYSGKLRGDLSTTPEYYASRNGVGDQIEPIYIACSAYAANDCFVGDWSAASNPVPADEDPYYKDVTEVEGALFLPDGGSVTFSDDEILNQSAPFRESSEDFGYQTVISCFDTFSSKYVYSMPDVLLTPRKHTADGFPDDFTKIGVLFSGMPYFSE